MVPLTINLTQHVIDNIYGQIPNGDLAPGETETDVVAQFLTDYANQISVGIDVRQASVQAQATATADIVSANTAAPATNTEQPLTYNQDHPLGDPATNTGVTNAATPTN